MIPLLNKVKSRALRWFVWARKLWENLDRLAKIGWGITIPWVAVIVTLVFCGDFKLSKLNEFGDFVAGATAPLAFLWLVLGYKQQGEELRLQRKEFAKSVEAMEAQAENSKHLLQDERERYQLSHKAIFCFGQLKRQTTYSSEDKCQFDFEGDVQNIGAPAMNVNLEFFSGDTLVGISSMRVLNKDEKRTLGVNIHSLSQQPPESISLRIEYTDFSGQARAELFNLKYIDVLGAYLVGGLTPEEWF